MKPCINKRERERKKERKKERKREIFDIFISLQIQLLHCIKQFTGEGGDTLLTDGFAAASKLRKNSPKDFDILAQTMIEFVDIGIDDGVRFHACWKAPIIELVQ